MFVFFGEFVFEVQRILCLRCAGICRNALPEYLVCCLYCFRDIDRSDAGVYLHDMAFDISRRKMVAEEEKAMDGDFIAGVMIIDNY